MKNKAWTWKKYLYFVMLLCGVLLLGRAVSVEAKTKIPKNLVEADQKQGIDVIYLIDNSKSIWEEDEQQEIRNQALKNITKLGMGSDIRVGILYFADHIFKEQTKTFTSIETKSGADSVLTSLNMKEQDYENRNTNIGAGLKEAAEYFDVSDESRRRVLILFSDGYNQHYDPKKHEEYKKKADKLTVEQTDVLKEQNVEIYCVYLEKKEENKQTDEKTLENIVSYNGEEKANVAERYFKVKEKDIKHLSDAFVSAFYGMQNMKYKELSFDSDGKFAFHIPESLGIEQLKIYLNGHLEEGRISQPSRIVDDSTEKRKDTSWDYDTAHFLIYEKPTAGDWTIEVGKPDKVVGSVNYYADLKATVKTKEKKGENYVEVTFYDKDGNKIAIDKNMKVTATVSFDQKMKKDLSFSVKDGKAVSEKFFLGVFGTYEYDVKASYGDLLSLTYSEVKNDVKDTAGRRHIFWVGVFFVCGILFLVLVVDTIQEYKKEKARKRKAAAIEKARQQKEEAKQRESLQLSLQKQEFENVEQAFEEEVQAYKKIPSNGEKAFNDAKKEFETFLHDPAYGFYTIFKGRLSEEQLGLFDAQAYFKEGYEEKLFEKGEHFANVLGKKREEMKVVEERVKKIKNEVDRTSYTALLKEINNVDACREKAGALREDVKKYNADMQGEAEKISKCQEMLMDLGDHLIYFTNRKIWCDLYITQIDGNSVNGVKLHKEAGKQLNSAYKLDDVNLYVEGKNLGDRVGETMIYVVSHPSKYTENCGLTFYSNQEFTMEDPLTGEVETGCGSEGIVVFRDQVRDLKITVNGMPTTVRIEVE